MLIYIEDILILNKIVRLYQHFEGFWSFYGHIWVFYEKGKRGTLWKNTNFFIYLFFNNNNNTKYTLKSRLPVFIFQNKYYLGKKHTKFDFLIWSKSCKKVHQKCLFRVLDRSICLFYVANVGSSRYLVDGKKVIHQVNIGN